MDPQIEQLLAAFDQSGRPAPGNISASLKSFPDVGTLPSPWETWTLIGLVRHRKRQYWVQELIHNRLRGNSASLGAMGALGHPEGVKGSGSVPGMPQWEYYFHGRGCCLTHKVTGETIDVDFWDETAEYFDVFFYERYLESLREPEPPEQRLLELHRSVRPINIAVARLVRAGAMAPRFARNLLPPRIANEVLAYDDSIGQFCLAWEDPANRVWIAGLVGDWLAAHEAAAGNAEIQKITGPRAQECRAIRRERLPQESGRAAPDALFGLAEMGNADDQLEAAFRGAPSSMVSAAVKIVGQQDHPKWCPHIYEMFQRTRPTGPIPEPHIWMTSLKFLLRHGHRKEEMIASLVMAGGTEIGEAALLALEYAPEHALPLIRRGLLTDIPCNRIRVAAILALIAKPWSIRELLQAVENSTEQEKTSDARAALLETGDIVAEKAVLAWEARNPHEGEPGKYLEINGRRVGPFFSMAEVALRNCVAFVRYEMDTLANRVLKIKDVVPPEPAGRNSTWWKFWAK